MLLIFAGILQTFYKCFHGTGMGLSHSGFCANLAVYAAVEKSFVHDFCRHGISTYLRYHDDIFFVFTSRLAMISFLKPLVQNSAYFKLIVSQVSSLRVEFLDLTASAVKGAIAVRPTLSKLPTPLCHSSARTLLFTTRGHEP